MANFTSPNVEGCFLSQLLPYDIDKIKRKHVRKALCDYQMLLNAFLEAINALKNGNLTKFNSLVGENSCHIRAIWIILIAEKSLVNLEALEKEIKNCLNKIDTFLLPKAITALIQSKTPLNAF